MERHPARSSLELLDEEDAGPDVDIAQAETQRLTKADAGAIEHHDEAPIERGAKRRALQAGRRRE